MRVNKLVSVVGIVLVAAIALDARAREGGGDGTGNGGEAVIRKGKTLLFDFFEAGVEEKVDVIAQDGSHIPKIKTPREKYIDQTLKTLLKRSPFSPEVQAILRKRWQIMSNFDALMMAGMLQTLEWNFPDEKLKRVNDGDSPLDVDQSSKYQAAHRRGRNVFINRKIKKKMSHTQLAGLVTHEILYAMAGEGLTNSFPIRSLNSRIFTAKPGIQPENKKLYLGFEKWNGRFVFRIKQFENSGLTSEWGDCVHSCCFLQMGRNHNGFTVKSPTELNVQNEFTDLQENKIHLGLNEYKNWLNFFDLNLSYPLLPSDRDFLVKEGEKVCELMVPKSPEIIDLLKKTGDWNKLQLDKNPSTLITHYRFIEHSIDFSGEKLQIIQRDTPWDTMRRASATFCDSPTRPYWSDLLIKIYEAIMEDLYTLD